MVRSFLDKINLIVWDWNGTIIDDVALCVDIINRLLEEHGLQRIGLKTYRRLFRFPVREYYKSLGFDFDKVSFDVVGQEFINRYNQNLDKITLQPGARELLEALKKADKTQVLISARKQSQLLEDVERFGLSGYFDRIIGLDDDLARGKEHLVREFFQNTQTDPEAALFIGDTEHDCRIAKSLGAHYFMVSNGHNSADRLMMCTQFVYANLDSLADFLFNA